MKKQVLSASIGMFMAANALAVECPKGTTLDTDCWECGEHCTAYISTDPATGNTHQLNIVGTGAMREGSNANDYPWVPFQRAGGVITSIVVGEGITSIPKGFSYDNRNLKNVSLPNSLEQMNFFSFYQAPNIQNLNIPNHVTIDEIAFKGTVVENLTCDENGLQGYLQSGKFKDSSFVNCTSGDCMSVLADYDAQNNTSYATTLKIAVKQADGSTNIYQNGKVIGFKGKRIYTLDEAEKVAKPAGNRFKIRYR